MRVQATVAIGGHPVLHGIDVTIAPGTFVALCGPNGAGKSTLLRHMAGVLPGGIPDPRRVAYVEQGARSAWGLTVRQVAALGRIPHGDSAPVDAALEQCGVAHLADRRVDQVSGGQARRTMLARAFATEPAVLLLDEPTSDLDPAAAHAIMALLAATAHAGVTIVAALHALELAEQYADRMIVLADGRVEADGVPGTVMPDAAQVFGMALAIDPRPRLVPIVGARHEARIMRPGS